MKKVIIISVLVLVLGLLTWAFIYDFNSRKELNNDTNTNGIDVTLTDENFIPLYEDMKANHDYYIGKVIRYEGFVHNNGDVCFVGRSYKDNVNKQNVIYGPECRFADGAKFEDGTWLRITGVLDEDIEDLTGKTYLYVLVGYGDYEEIEEGNKVIGEIN